MNYVDNVEAYILPVSGHRAQRHRDACPQRVLSTPGGQWICSDFAPRTVPPGKSRPAARFASRQYTRVVNGIALTHLDALPDRSTPCDPNWGFFTLADPHAAAGHAARDRWRDAPVACSLTREGLGDRADQWRTVIADAARRPIPDGIELTVPIGHLADVVELAAAEQARCPFFDFRLQLDGLHLHVEVRASTEGRAMLTALFDQPAD